jgi:hypothetical protein
MNACEATYMFALKALMRDIPFTMITIGLVISVVIAGYAFKMFE